MDVEYDMFGVVVGWTCPARMRPQNPPTMRRTRTVSAARTDVEVFGVLIEVEGVGAGAGAGLEVEATGVSPPLVLGLVVVIVVVPSPRLTASDPKILSQRTMSPSGDKGDVTDGVGDASGMFS